MPDSPGSPHYTVHRHDPTRERVSDMEARELLEQKLRENFAATFWIVIEQRKRGRAWTKLASFETFHADEPVDNDTPDEVRRDDLIDQIMREADAEDDGTPREIRVYGCGERKSKVVWKDVQWITGEPLAATPAEQRDNATLQVLLSIARINEAQGRQLERAYVRTETAQEKSLHIAGLALEKIDKATDRMLSALDLVVTARKDASAFAVEQANVEIRKQEVANKHELDLAEQESNDQLTMFALQTLAEHYWKPDDDEKKNDDAPSGDAAPSADGATTSTTSESAERKPFAGAGPRCEQAKDLASIFHRLSVANLTKLKNECFSINEWDALEEACRCETVQQFDAAFGKAHRLMHERDDGGASLLTQVGPILGGMGMRLMKITADYERRRDRRR